jgi:alpha-galactosidase
LEAEVLITNPRRKPFVADLSVRCVDLKEKFQSRHRAASLKVSVPAGKTLRKKVVLPRSGGLDEEFSVQVSCDSPEVLTRDYIFRKRKVLAAGEKGGAPIELKLAGFPAVEGNIAVEGKRLSLRLAVDDTKISPAQNPWDGSDAEIYFANPGERKINRYIFVPQPGGRKLKVLDEHLKPTSAVTAMIKAHPRGTGYEIEATIPFAAAGVTADSKHCLFDVIVNLSALGDAHSGGRTSLSGGFYSSHETTLYAQLELK